MSIFNDNLKVFKDNGKRISVYLRSGIALSGVLSDFDEQTLVITNTDKDLATTISRSSVSSFNAYRPEKSKK